MRKFDVNKIMRDSTYQQMESECAHVVSEDLNQSDFQSSLKLKLQEEVDEVIAETSKEGLCEEIADVLEVIDGIIAAYQLDKQAISDIKAKKKQDKGGFTRHKRCLYVVAEPDNPMHRDLIEYCVTRPEKYPETTTTLYLSPPEGYVAELEVSAIYVYVNDEILLLKRATQKSEGNQWGVPAGKFETNETALDCALRELTEETGIVCEPSALQPIRSVYVVRPGVNFIYHMFALQLSEKPEVTLSPTEHGAYQWVSLSQAMTLPLMGGALDSLYIFRDFITENAPSIMLESAP